MKKFMAVAALGAVLFGMVSDAHALVSVRGYTRSNGTYVAPHFRTNPDGNPYNNFSYWN